HHFQRFHLNTIAAHTTRHAHTFKYAAGVRRTTNRARRALTVVLAVGSFAHTGKTMAFYHALEALTFGSTYYVHLFTFGEDVAIDRFTNLFVYGTVTDFFYYSLRCCICFRKMV